MQGSPGKPTDSNGSHRGAPTLFGIVNITEDSFSDGGQYLDESALERRILELDSNGCDVLDLGAASSNPKAHPVDPVTEIRRLEMALGIVERLRNARNLNPAMAISVDSFSPAVQRFALSCNVDYLNDIAGFRHSDLYEDLARSHCNLILMHAIQEGVATETHVDPATILPRIIEFFGSRLQALQSAGIARNRIILDPGMGFFLGTDPECSLTVLRNLNVIRAEFGLPLLVSVSRKSFLGSLTGRPPSDRGPATLACEMYLADRVEYIRTHDTGALRDALAVQNRLKSASGSHQGFGQASQSF
ncbi:MAG: dihydropteroate synthase [Leptospiraceae bacterium]|nr:dihydropteroate synthase [Leptospiraceae bacterium]